MGEERKKRKIRRMNEKKFVFDWDAGEDTSQDFNPLYAKRHTIQMFGRGHMAGIDEKEQKKQRSVFYDKLLDDRRTIEEKGRARYVNIASMLYCDLMILLTLYVAQ
jgi:ATP-dependent RNA helicase DDX23/PRP28